MSNPHPLSKTGFKSACHVPSPIVSVRLSFFQNEDDTFLHLLAPFLNEDRLNPEGMQNMNSRQRIVLTIAVALVLIVSAVSVSAKNARSPGQTATKVRIELRDIYGALFVTIGGTEKKITDQAQQAWMINRGRHVVYSSSEGAGGYENEGQSLHLYDVETGNQKRIMSHYFMVQTVRGGDKQEKTSSPRHDRRRWFRGILCCGG